MPKLYKIEIIKSIEMRATAEVTYVWAANNEQAVEFAQAFTQYLFTEEDDEEPNAKIWEDNYNRYGPVYEVVLKDEYGVDTVLWNLSRVDEVEAIDAFDAEKLPRFQDDVEVIKVPFGTPQDREIVAGLLALVEEYARTYSPICQLDLDNPDGAGRFRNEILTGRALLERLEAQCTKST